MQSQTETAAQSPAHTLVLVPSSRLVDREMQVEVGQIPPVLTPICGKTVLDLVVEQYASILSHGELVVMAHEGGDRIASAVSQQNFDESVSVLCIPKVDELGEAILSALNTLHLSSYDSLVINFGDTLLKDFVDPRQNTIFYADLEESYRWTSFKSEQGKLTEITDRFVSEKLESSHVFCGVFVINDPVSFRNCLRDAVATDGVSRFYSALQSYYDSKSYQLVRSDQWMDFGHVDNYYQAKKRLVMRRFFNDVVIDERHATLRKTSLNVEKLSDEIRWYLQLPGNLRKYLPQIFNYSLTGYAPFIEMEYYGYPTLSELYTSHGHNLGIWNHVFQGLFSLLKEMRLFWTQEDAALQVAAMRDMYVTKTVGRLNQIRDHSTLGVWLTSEININGKKYPPLDASLAKLEPLVDRVLLSNPVPFSVIHGDFCLSNLLFDPRSRIMKMVDPRGRFGSHNIYGDPRYDLAKLSHSFNGSYDLIMNGNFFAIVQSNDIKYQLYLNTRQQQITNLFNTWAGKVFPDEVEAMRLIEALLFLSMIPLHDDRLDRQIAMLAIGIENFNSLLDTYGIA